MPLGDSVQQVSWAINIASVENKLAPATGDKSTLPTIGARDTPSFAANEQKSECAIFVKQFDYFRTTA